MEKARRVFRIGLALLIVAALQSVGAPEALAKDKAKSADTKGSNTADKKMPAGPPLNACGCYRKDSGGCVCTDKKGKCDCPGDCEPVGCDAKREKELEREMAAEVKRAQDDERKRKEAEEAEEARRAKEFERANPPPDQAQGDAGAAPEAPPPKNAKAPPKAVRKAAPPKPE
jgi:hypothetical protein